MRHLLVLWLGAVLLFAAPLPAQDARAQMDGALKSLSPHVAAESDREPLRGSLGRALRERIAAANRSSSEAWNKIQTRADWEPFKAEKIAELRKSLGTLPPRPPTPKLLVTGTIAGEGFQIQNLVYESRPGLVVTANLYVPQPLRDKMPGIAIAHSHHNPKWEGELQDMGMTWARAGCYVLVPDALGHGERRQHPFVTAADYAQEFQLGRQDYNFRYDTSLQLYAVGETLMGWMAHDLMTGFDVLAGQPGIDDSRLILLGSVAGGGDPAGVTAALDERIDCLVPFNFGGPQPENRYPLPDDAEASFNYAGGGSWESTRNLYRSAADGFLPWVIVGSIAPRKLIHAHEFSWDRQRDPVWKRYQKIFGTYGAEEGLAFTTGFGTIQNTQAPASHCNNIGAAHRKQIHEAFRTWFGIEVSPDSEYRSRRTREELTCLTDAARKQFQPLPLHAILAAVADERLAAVRQAQGKEPAGERRRLARETWTRLLGNIEPPAKVAVRDGSPAMEEAGGVRIRREFLDTDPGISVPVMTLSLTSAKEQPAQRNVLVGLAADGMAGVLKRRQADLSAALGSGATVVLADLRGTGAAGGSNDQGQQSSATSYSATSLMLGEPLLAGQLRDLLAVLRHAGGNRTAGELKIVLLGDSGAAPLAADAAFNYPRRVDRPAECQATTGLLVLLAALGDDRVSEVSVRHNLASYRSLLESPFVQVPHAAIPPGILLRSDMPDLIAAIAPCRVSLDRPVDGRNRLVAASAVRQAYQAALSGQANALANVSIQDDSR